MIAARTLASLPATGHTPAAPSPGPYPRRSGAHGLDRALFIEINHLSRHTLWLHQPLHTYARLGMAVLALLLVVAWWAARRRDPATMAAALWTGAGAVIAEGLAHLIQPLADEARPWRNLPHALILVGHSSQYSFPSGDGVVTGAVAAGLFLYQRRLAIAVAVAGLVDCFGWVYIGAHYPQDVAGGLLIGAAVVLGGWFAARGPLTAAVQWLAATPLRFAVPEPASSPEPAGSPETANAATPASRTE